MIRVVVFCALLSAIVVNVRPSDIDFAAEARRLVHQSIWASVGTISTNASIEGYPYVTVVAVADSSVNSSSAGHIFFFMKEEDIITKDLIADNRTSFMFTDEQTRGCTKRGVAPWSHECHRAIILGQVAKLKAGSEELARGMKAFQSRHPDLGLGLGVDFNLWKLEMSNVLVLGGFGGYHHVSRDDYYRITTPTTTTTATPATEDYHHLFVS